MRCRADDIEFMISGTLEMKIDVEVCAVRAAELIPCMQYKLMLFVVDLQSCIDLRYETLWDACCIC